MKTILLICLIVLYNNAFTTSQVLTRFLKHNPPPPNVTERRLGETLSGAFTQKLDHFDPNNTQTWSQKFFVNTEFFNKSSNNVAFLMLEQILSESWMTGGSWVNNAEKYGAIMFQIEHRYYGESSPFPDLATENLRFLSSQQVLADAAEFIKAMTIQYSLGSDVKWVAFGGYYPGSLAAWLRLKYPDLVYAAVASSAPLQAQLGFPGYFQEIVNHLKDVSEECVANLEKGMAQIEDLLVNSNSSDENITSVFNLCDPIEQYDLDSLNVDYFYSKLAFGFAAIVEFFDSAIHFECDIINDESRGSEMQRIVDTTHASTSCLSYNLTSDIESINNISNFDGINRLWYYQLCTEFGWFQTTSEENKVFGRGVSVDIFQKICTDTYGPDFNSTFTTNQVEKTNDYYHGTDINATRIVFVHGSNDPWHVAGLLKSNNADSPVILIEGTHRYTDMYAATEDDLPQLTEAREEISRLIGNWLGYN